tara:strand:- start:1919 stop:2683 length:765 start_codon:yes stop_codon:yes gene_type:complete
MTTIYKYRVYCTTDSTYKFVWSEVKPLTCPDNTAHSINSLLTTIVDEVTPNQVSIKEENVPTGGNYQASSVAFENMTGPTGTVYSVDKSWPHPISAMNISVKTEEIHAGDTIEVVVGPETVIGALTVTAETGATEFNVSQTVIDYTMVGYYLELVEGANINDCGRVIAVDKTNGIIQLENPTTRTFSAGGPTYVRQSVFTVKDFKCCTPQKFDIGIAKIGGSYVPPNTIVRGKYTINKPSDIPKNFTAMIEFLY